MYKEGTLMRTPCGIALTQHIAEKETAWTLGVQNEKFVHFDKVSSYLSILFFSYWCMELYLVALYYYFEP